MRIQEKNIYTQRIVIQITQLLSKEWPLHGMINKKHKQLQLVTYIRNIAWEQALLSIVLQLHSLHLTLQLSDFIKLK